MRDMNGLHAPNFRFYFVGDMCKAAGVLGSLTFLHLQLMRDDLLGNLSGDIENLNWYKKVRLGFNDNGVVVPPSNERLIHIRYYHPHSLSQDPKEIGKHIADLFAHWKGARDHENLTANLWDDPRVLVSVSNELNLHYENGDADAGNQWKYRTQAHYERIAAWEMEVWRTIDSIVPNRKALSLSGALAEGHDPVDGDFAGVPDGHYQITAVKEWLSSVDVIGAHPYAHLDWVNGWDTVDVAKDGYWHLFRLWRPKNFKNTRETWDGKDPGGLATQYPNRKLFISEYGTFTHSNPKKTTDTWNAIDIFNKYCAAQGNVLGATCFIWSSYDDHKDNTIILNGDLRNRFVSAPRYTSKVEVPSHIPADTPTPKPEPEIPPVPTYNPNPNNYVVGSGFLNKMTELKDVAASDEMYMIGQTGTRFSLAVGESGKLYMYNAKTGVRVYNPLA